MRSVREIGDTRIERECSGVMREERELERDLCNEIRSKR